MVLELMPYRTSPNDVVNQWKQQKDEEEEKKFAVRVEVIVPRYLAQKEASHCYLNQCKNIIGRRFVEAFGKRSLDDISPVEFNDWLEDISTTPRQFNNHLKNLKPFFTYALRMEFAVKSPARGTVPKKIKTKAPCVLSLRQSRILLGVAASEYGGIAPIALLLFTGIRPHELELLTWNDVLLDSRRVITISEEISKTYSIRNIKIEDNLYNFLISLPDDVKQGSICPVNWKTLWHRIRVKAGISHMQDCCRHSYGSYWLTAHGGDMAGLLQNMGHTTQQTTLKHYLAAVLEEDAKEFWTINISDYVVDPDKLYDTPPHTRRPKSTNPKHKAKPQPVLPPLNPIPVSDLVVNFMDSRKNKESIYYQRLSAITSSFVATFGQLSSLDDVPHDDFLLWLNTSSPSRNAFNGNLKKINTLAYFAILHGFASKSPGEGINNKEKEDPSILSISQRDKLLDVAKKHPGCYLPVCLRVFTSLDAKELKRVTWNHLHTSKEKSAQHSGYIDLPADRDNPARKITLSENLVDYINAELSDDIKSLSQDDLKGKIIPDNWPHLWGRIRAEAGINSLHDHNICWHSFSAYWLANNDYDTQALTQHLGRKPEPKTLAFYKTAVTPKEAKQYWSHPLTTDPSDHTTQPPTP
jgi:integrase